MSLSEIKLNFINQSNDTNNSSVVIFQKNVAESFGEVAVAWKVIENCGNQCSHPFTYPFGFHVGAKDAWGNHTPRLRTADGQAYEMVRDASGNVLQEAATPATNPDEVDVSNNLQQGAVDACIYRDGRLLATKANMAPGQKAVFQFHPRIYIGVVSEIEESSIMNSAIIQSINTGINLLGIQSADIVMTGGGPGPDSTDFKFNLANVNFV